MVSLRALCTLCAAISGEISILIQTRESLGKGFLYQESAVGRVTSNVLVINRITL